MGWDWLDLFVHDLFGFLSISCTEYHFFEHFQYGTDEESYFLLRNSCIIGIGPPGHNKIVDKVATYTSLVH